MKIAILSVLLFAIAIVFGEINVALNKPTSQSSTYDTGVVRGDSSKAVDGNTDGDWNTATITSTVYEANPWWQCDLQSATTINKIVVYNRIDCCSDRLNYFKIDLKDANNVVVRSVVMQGTQQVYTWSFPRTSARYVFIQLLGTNMLSLSEVEVLQSPDNLALGKVATQSSTYSDLSVASKAVDGSSAGSYPGGSITHTGAIYEIPWWEVNLGTASTVDQVIVHNRADCCYDRLTNFKIILLDASNNVLKTSPNFKGVQMIYSYTFNPVAGVQKVRIELPVGSIPLQLAEVEVLNSGNLARGKTTTQSSTYSGTSVQSSVDGVADGGWSSGSVASTNEELNSWHQVDLGVDTSISKVVIFNRVDCCASRLPPFNVILKNNAGTVVHQKLFVGTQQIYVLSKVASARYVIIQSASTSIKFTAIAEVEVYSSSDPFSSCRLWDGTAPQVGDKLAFRSQVTKDYFTYIRNEKWLTTALYGSNPYNMYTYMTIDSSPTPTDNVLFRVDESIPVPGYGWDVKLTHIKSGQKLTVASGSSSYESQQEPNSATNYATDTMRLAYHARAWTDAACGSCAGWTDVSPPNIIPQWKRSGTDLYSCSQKKDYYSMLWWSCGDWYVSYGGYGGENNRDLARYMNYYTLYVC